MKYDMKEDFIHYIWRTLQFDLSNLRTTSNQKLLIIDAGQHNFLAGPDFLQCKIKLDNEIWAGNIEMHLNASDWNKHGHQGDLLYNNVILHVVLNPDCEISRSDNTIIPCFSIKNRILPQTYKSYHYLMRSSKWISCSDFYHKIDDIIKSSWFDRLVTEKLDQKINKIDIIHESNTHNREQTFFQLLCRNFGFGVNNDFFEDLATRLNYCTILKNQNNIHDVESIIFGTAGLLSPANLLDEYTRDLYRRFKHFKIKYDLIPKQALSLHFFKLRPANFPTIRLAQLSAFLFGNQNIWSKVLAAKDVKGIQNMFDIEVSSYWKLHYNFGKLSKRKSNRKLSTNAIHLIIINTIVPFMFHYGRSRNEDQWVLKAYNYLSSLPAEKNSVINHWKKLGENPSTALESQALLFLKNNYCSRKKCLHCAIAHQWMKQKN